MAFLKKIKIEENYETLYYKIISIYGDAKNMQINIGVFKSKEDADKNENMIGYGKHFFTPDINGNNFIKQAYEFLKTQPGFEDITDI